MLVARRADRLESLAEELTRAHGVTVTVVARDLGQPDAGRTLRAELESRGIYATGLVNNAGFGTHDAFTDEDPERLQDMIALNVGALVDLSRAYIDPLTSADTGVLINVASLLGFQPTPYMSVYGATKAFVLSFTEVAVGGEPRHRPARPRRLPRAHARPSSTTPPAASRPTTARSAPPPRTSSGSALEDPRPSLRAPVGDHQRPPARPRQQVPAPPPCRPVHGPTWPSA